MAKKSGTGDRREKGMGARFYSETKKLWIARIELPHDAEGNRRKKEVTAKTEDALKEKVRVLQRQFILDGDLPTGGDTVRTWMTYWLDNVAVKKVRPNTFAGYRAVVNNQIIPAIGNIKLDKLNASHVRRVHDYVMRDKSSTYALNAHRVLTKALNDAMREGKVHRNPAELVDAPRKERKQLEALTVTEAIAVVKWCVAAFETEPYDPEPARWATYLLTGARRGEVIGLEWDRVTDHIDLSWQLQRVQDISRAPRDYEYREIGNGMYWTRPKSAAGWRVVPLVDPLATILEEHRKRSSPNPFGLVFVGPKGNPLDPDTETRTWPRRLSASGLTAKKVRLHDLRHTTVDLLYEAGVPEDVIMEIVGHSVRTVTRGYKARGNQKRLTEGMLQLSALLNRDV